MRIERVGEQSPPGLLLKVVLQNSEPVPTHLDHEDREPTYNRGQKDNLKEPLVPRLEEEPVVV